LNLGRLSYRYEFSNSEQAIATVGSGTLGHPCKMLLCSLCWYVENTDALEWDSKKDAESYSLATRPFFWAQI